MRYHILIYEILIFALTKFCSSWCRLIAMFASQCQTINQERHHPLSKFSRSPAPLYMLFYNFLYPFLTRIFDRIFSCEQNHWVCRSLILLEISKKPKTDWYNRSSRDRKEGFHRQESSMSMTASWLDLFIIAQTSSFWQQRFLPNYLPPSQVNKQIWAPLHEQWMRIFWGGDWRDTF